MNEVYLCIHTGDTIEEYYGRLNLLALLTKTLLSYPISEILYRIIPFCFRTITDFLLFVPYINVFAIAQMHESLFKKKIPYDAYKFI